MATFLDITLVEQFSAVVAMIFVFAVIYMILQATKVVGDNKGIHSIIAFCIALFVLFSSTVRNVIMQMSPWFVLMFVVILFILIAVKMLGIKDADIAATVIKDDYRYILYFIVVFAAVIVMFSLSQSLGQSAGPYLSDGNTTGAPPGMDTSLGSGSTNTGDFNINLAATIFHPKVLGMCFLFVVASFTIRLLAQRD